MFPICTVTQMRQLEDQALQSGASHAQLMHRAGRALADGLLAFATRNGYARGPVLVLAGPGHNGGDGLICARRLQEAGERVFVYAWRRAQRPADALRDALAERHVDVADAENDADYVQLRRWLRVATWCVDALLGTGADRPAEEPLAELLNAVRATLTDTHRVCAADCPSGVRCDTGEVSPATLPADLTIMFGAAKRGLYLPAARAVCGVASAVDIGLPADATARLPLQGLETRDLAALLPRRSDWSHKGTFGKALCVVGSQRYPGAAYLSAMAAARSGAGLVTAAVPESVQTGLMAAMPEVTFLPLAHRAGVHAPASLPSLEAEWARYDAVLLGCGLSCTDSATAFVRAFLKMVGADRERATRLVVDADGLNCLARMPDWPYLLPPETVLTPHPAEMARLTGRPAAAIEGAEAETALECARQWRCVVVLKGPHTWIASPDGQAFAVTTANSALATAGTGDVLAGLTVGLLAQGQAPVQAACGAALAHSRAGLACARAIGAAGTVASDVLDRIPAALRPAWPRRGA